MATKNDNEVIVTLNAGEVITPMNVINALTSANAGNPDVRANPYAKDDDDDEDDEKKADELPKDFEDDEGMGGVMVAFVPAAPEDFATEGGLDVEELHVTVCFLGSEEDITDGAQQLIRDATLEVSETLRAFDAEVCGVGVLGDEGATVLFLESKTFCEVKDGLSERLQTIMPRDAYPHFIPHMTLGYNLTSSVVDEYRPRIGETVRLSGVRAAFGGDNYDFNLQEPSEEADRMNDTQKTTTVEPPVPSASERDQRPLNVEWSQRAVTAESTVDHRRLPDQVLERLAAANVDVGVIDRVGRALCQMRFKPEIRQNKDGSVGVHGYATVYDYAYDVGDGPPFGWSETIAGGACDKSVSEGADVRFLINHDGIALGRTRSKTMTLTSDDHGLYVDVPGMDMRSPLVMSLVSAMERGDMDEMSFAFKAIRQEWNEDYTERSITEVKLYDASVVTYPANPATVMSLHGAGGNAPEEDSQRSEYPIDLALAEAASAALRSTAWLSVPRAG